MMQFISTNGTQREMHPSFIPITLFPSPIFNWGRPFLLVNERQIAKALNEANLLPLLSRGRFGAKPKRRTPTSIKRATALALARS